MAKQKPSDRRKGGMDSDFKEPDITPIMNLTFMLILALLTMASFLPLGLINIQAPQLGGGASGANQAPQDEEKKLNLTLFVTMAGFNIAASGATLDGSSEGRTGEPLVPKLTVEGKLDYNYPELNRRLIEIKKTFPRETAVIIVADPDVIYDDIVKVMDASRENAEGKELFPAVAFSPGILG
jgi:biopolymer transport protein ExbD